jgi:hypothetical protein
LLYCLLSFRPIVAQSFIELKCHTPVNYGLSESKSN